MVQEPMSGKVAMFEGKQVRKILSAGEWWFSVVDIVQVLTGSSIPKRYWSDLKRKLVAEGFAEPYEKIVRLKMPAPDGKMRLTDCASTETMLRIIQSIPSPKVEQVKGLARENLRDHMTDIELILTMLAEATTTKLHRDRDTQGFDPLKKDAQDGGAVAGRTRRDIEERSGKPVVTSANFKGLTGKGRKRLGE